LKNEILKKLISKKKNPNKFITFEPQNLYIAVPASFMCPPPTIAVVGSPEHSNLRLIVEREKKSKA
jgi:hypothetical protein